MKIKERRYDPDVGVNKEDDEGVRFIVSVFRGKRR